ncbi:hypothetical protein CDD80_7283 [Ophiocordyceps camponoti-rufipedis]|uniref:Uncharacterized protein n=1 Tax=Ophiocordyceps camponoti-rufipedis TaxID=2004952 RepID=A0A2C5YN51_9HYPO|nr:hypothetical protein CDD80_7283 [Ophiocordyceps camponoti-rufipedis]
MPFPIHDGYDPQFRSNNASQMPLMDLLDMNHCFHPVNGVLPAPQRALLLRRLAIAAMGALSGDVMMRQLVEPLSIKFEQDLRDLLAGFQAGDGGDPPDGGDGDGGAPGGNDGNGAPGGNDNGDGFNPGGNASASYNVEATDPRNLILNPLQGHGQYQMSGADRSGDRENDGGAGMNALSTEVIQIYEDEPQNENNNNNNNNNNNGHDAGNSEVENQPPVDPALYSSHPQSAGTGQVATVQSASSRLNEAITGPRSRPQGQQRSVLGDLDGRRFQQGGLVGSIANEAIGAHRSQPQLQQQFQQQPQQQLQQQFQQQQLQQQFQQQPQQELQPQQPQQPQQNPPQLPSSSSSAPTNPFTSIDEDSSILHPPQSSLENPSPLRPMRWPGKRPQSLDASMWEYFHRESVAGNMRVSNSQLFTPIDGQQRLPNPNAGPAPLMNELRRVKAPLLDGRTPKIFTDDGNKCGDPAQLDITDDGGACGKELQRHMVCASKDHLSDAAPHGVCDDCSQISANVTRSDRGRISELELEEMRAYLCTECSITPLAQLHTRLFNQGVSNIYGASLIQTSKQLISDPRPLTVHSHVFPATGCTCASKMFATRLCRHHRLFYAQRVMQRIQAVRDWRARAFNNRLSCPTCLAVKPVSEAGLSTRLSVNHPAAWICMLCNDAVVEQADRGIIDGWDDWFFNPSGTRPAAEDEDAEGELIEWGEESAVQG